MKLSECAREQNHRVSNLKSLRRTLLSPAGIVIQCILAIAVVNFVVLVRPALAADPEIKDFEGTEEMQDWTFTGQIINAGDPVGIVVTFGGLMQGQSVTCSDPTGYFKHTASPGITPPGTVTGSIPGSSTVEFFCN